MMRVFGKSVRQVGVAWVVHVIWSRFVVARALMELVALGRVLRCGLVEKTWQARLCSRELSNVRL
jgi:hypothetical protein